MILTKERDPRLITVRRGGSLQDRDHHLLALWAVSCAMHVLPLFEQEQPADDRPRRALDLARAWTRGETTMTQARTAALLPMPPQGRCPARQGKRPMLPDKLRPCLMLLPTNSAQPRTRFGLCVPRPVGISVMKWGVWSVSGSVRNFQTRSGNSC